MDVAEVTRQIDERLAELRDEVDRLQRARDALTNGSAPRRRASGGTRRGRRRGSGTRAVQALALVQQQPGITIPELAERMGIKQNYLYRVMPTLAGEGRVRKDDKGWFPVEQAAA